MLQIGAVVWGVKDVERAVAFWAAALDYEVKYHAPDDFAILKPRTGDGIQLSISKVSSPKACTKAAAVTGPTPLMAPELKKAKIADFSSGRISSNS